MPQKSSAAVQAVPTQPSVKVAGVEKLFERMDRLYETIARSAYDLFEKGGRIHGRDLDHWFQAEGALLHPISLQIEQRQGELFVRAEVPGFAANDLEVHVEPNRLIISGKRASTQESRNGRTVYTETSSDEVLRSIALPAEVNASKVSATLKNGILEIELPKAEAKKSSRVGPEAA
jgi:HSP20 family protein